MPHFVLYYSPGACSLAAHIALREWGVPFELKRVVIAQGDLATPEFLALNPRARVPLLLIDGKPVRELSGILTWIGQQSGLYPQAGSYEAARCAEWLAWMTSGVHISFALLWRGGRFLDDARLFSLLRTRGYAWLQEQFSEIEAALTPGPYALGDQYSVVDCNLVPFYRWGIRVGFDMPRDYPHWRAHTERMLTRRAVSEAIAAEGIDFLPPDLSVIPARPKATSEALSDFDAAWTARDTDALMHLMAPDGVYAASVGPEPGQTFKGAAAVRAGIEKMLTYDGARQRISGESWVLGDTAFAEWSFEEPSPNGPRIIRGIDRFQFSDEGIVLKDAFRKVMD